VDLVSLADIEAAAVRIRPAARVTPLLEVPWPTRDGNGRLLLKCENLQPMGAFKIRGAYNMLAQLPPEALQRGVITYSSGNHGQAVALAARTLGAPAVIVMPTTAPSIKVEGARAYGAEVTFAGTTSLDRKQRAEELARERRLTIVPPFDHSMIIAGQGTVGLEILEQCPDVGAVLVEVGGGGLSSGVSAAIKQRAPHIRVVGVEPEGAPKMKRSLEAGHVVTLDKTSSIADGLLTVRPGDLTFEHVRAFIDEVVTVPDDEMVRAIGWLFRNARLVVEPSGAVTVAALMRNLGGIAPSSGPVVAIVSGGNVEPEQYARYISQR
jgi:threo-3-hydroxy-L-aspartate ammonia-lyase